MHKTISGVVYMKEFEQHQRLYHAAAGNFDTMSDLRNLNVSVEEVYFSAWKNEKKVCAIVETHKIHSNGLVYQTNRHELSPKGLFDDEDIAQQYGRALLYKKIAQTYENVIEDVYFEESIELFPEMYI